MTSLGNISRAAFGVLALGAVASAGCFDSGMRVPPQPPEPAELDLSVTYQRIDGFGASSAWTANNISDALADQFFSPDTGIGLSLLRIQIKPTGTTAEMGTAMKAVARGAKVWAAPWTPPVDWKQDTDACGYAGTLQDAHRQDWADRLASFAASMAAQGIPLVAISAQNEPNYPARAKQFNADGTPICSSGWDSCLYSPDQMVTFVRDFLGPALAVQNPYVPVMAPETQGWDQFKRWADPLMADSGAVSRMGPIATHHYAGSPSVYQAAVTAGKAIWETEISDTKVSTPDPGIDSGLRVAALIHDDLVSGNVSAWHYWWLMPGSDDNSALVMKSTQMLATRAWVLGNWSRFVRPGFVRVSLTAQPQNSIYLSAFKNPDDGRVVVVAVNQGYGNTTQDFTVAGGTIAELTPWVTSASQKLAQQAPVAVADGAVSVTLPPRSVTSFVGTFMP